MFNINNFKVFNGILKIRYNKKIIKKYFYTWLLLMWIIIYLFIRHLAWYTKLCVFLFCVFKLSLPVFIYINNTFKNQETRSLL